MSEPPASQPNEDRKDKPRLPAIGEVETFLRGHLGGEVRDVAPLGSGDWSQAFSFKQGEDDLVARFGAHVDDFEKDRFASRFSSPRLPIPKVREIGEGLGRYFCISERAYGEFLEALDAERMRRIVPAVFQVFDALRDADVSAWTGFGGWGADGHASSSTWKECLLAVDKESARVNGWHALMAESPTGTALYDEALEYLRSNVHVCPEIRHLLHTDLLHFNVLAADDTITAVVDWGNAQYGDFLYELAAFTFYAPWYPAMTGIDWRFEARRHYEQAGCEIPHFDERLRCYEAHIGLGGMAYSAFTKGWKDLADTAGRTLELIRGGDSVVA